MKSNLQKLTLTIDGARIPSDRFLKAVASFVALINDVSETVTSEHNAFRWLISVEAGSAVLHFKPEPNKANPALIERSLRAIDEGLKTIRKRPERPRYWSDNALRKAKELSEVLDVEAGIDSVSIRADHKPIDITRKISANVDELIGSEYKSLGTIEGRLRTVTEAGGVHFVVQDALTHNNVRCYFDPEKADEYMTAWRKRVAVYGEIRYRKDRMPVSITVQRFRVLRESKELPAVKEMRGILAS